MMPRTFFFNVFLAVTWCLMLVVHGGRKIPNSEPCPMCDFVYADDGVFNFEITDQWNMNDEAQIPVTTYLFNMTSVKYWEGGVVQPIWWHAVIVNIPDTIQNPNKAFLMLTGLESWQLVDANNKDLIGTARIAAATGTVTATLYHVPKDPVTFLMDPRGQPLDSDFAMAFAQTVFYKIQNPIFLMQLAMTKAVIKVMDLIQNPGIPGYTPKVEKFTVAGESKRGWIAWFAGAMDDRVEALIPVTASSFSEFDQNVHLMFKSYGGYGFFHGLELFGGIFEFTDSEQNKKLAAIVDPLSYKDYLDMPKLMVVAASDDVFLPDATKLWFNRMPGENKLWILENSGHFLEFYPPFQQYWQGIGAFYASIVQKYDRPCVSWKLRASASKKSGSIVMFSSQIPKRVEAYYADSVDPNRRDFRSIVFCPTCPLMKLCDTCPEMTIKFSGVQWISDTGSIKMARTKVLGQDLSAFSLIDSTRIKSASASLRFDPTTALTMYRYKVTYDFPETGYLGFFMKMVFDGPNGADMTYTSEMNIIPNTFPSPDCVAAACGEKTIPLV